MVRQSLRHVMTLGNLWIIMGLPMGKLMGIRPMSMSQSQPRILEDLSITFRIKKPMNLSLGIPMSALVACLKPYSEFIWRIYSKSG